MSWLSKAKNFVFNSIFAQAARAASSSNPTQAAAGSAALSAVTSGVAGAAAKAIALNTVAVVASDIANGIQAHNSATGIASAVVGDFEDGLKTIVDGFVTTLANGVPLIGGLIAPEAVNVVNMGLTFGEQHALTYISALFANHKAVAAASVAPPAAPSTGATGTPT